MGEPTMVDRDAAINAAVWMFRGFMGGLIAREKREGRVTEAEATAWRDHAVRTFESGLRDMI